MPLGAGFVLAFVVLPAVLCGEVKEDVVALVLGGFGFCILSEAADEGDLVEHGVMASFLLVCPAVCGTCLPNGCADATHSQGEWMGSAEGDPNLFRGRSPHRREARSGSQKRERAIAGRGCFERGTLNADRETNQSGATFVQHLVCRREL